MTRSITHNVGLLAITDLLDEDDSKLVTSIFKGISRRREQEGIRELFKIITKDYERIYSMAILSNERDDLERHSDMVSVVERQLARSVGDQALELYGRLWLNVDMTHVGLNGITRSKTPNYQGVESVYKAYQRAVRINRVLYSDVRDNHSTSPYQSKVISLGDFIHRTQESLLPIVQKGARFRHEADPTNDPNNLPLNLNAKTI